VPTSSAKPTKPSSSVKPPLSTGASSSSSVKPSSSAHGTGNLSWSAKPTTATKLW
jgi:hypothetical protein